MSSPAGGMLWLAQGKEKTRMMRADSSEANF